MLPNSQPAMRYTLSQRVRQEQREKRQCVICTSMLRPAEDVYCRSCDTIIDQRMHVKYGTKR